MNWNINNEFDIALYTNAEMYYMCMKKQSLYMTVIIIWILRGARYDNIQKLKKNKIIIT